MWERRRWLAGAQRNAEAAGKLPLPLTLTRSLMFPPLFIIIIVFVVIINLFRVFSFPIPQRV